MLRNTQDLNREREREAKFRNTPDLNREREAILRNTPDSNRENFRRIPNLNTEGPLLATEGQHVAAVHGIRDHNVMLQGHHAIRSTRS